ncbi:MULTISPECIES: CPBP family intramembrane glutamic endopeptidase [unclassified Microbacterium]|uniref:CPBP family intramembrane glutamic endopeptidase n=1 Tax=unclassified Microbacterium TaxID=2609290 RepID=UPI000EAA4A5A|nr:MULTISPECIES: CPBP family intramembrane glutamic endopeptidase [unclassified Microbacterium]MBT2485482.1 CPBP family intramembrane metalloprotease [Microbacterium sp. ISL-108]RKN68277.1 CPBP family intramembrane metalloprotease [Microbacterium sp. CGR2]
MTEVTHGTTLRAGLAPALLVCAAAPAFFVLQIPWLGWALLALGVGAAWLVERGRTAEDSTVRVGARRETARVIGDHRAPSLTRDLSLIAFGMLIVSIIPLAAELDNLAMLRFTLALGGAVAVPYVISRYVYRDRAISFPWRTHRRWGRLQWGWLVAVLVLGWLILPFYFITSGVYQNWPVVDTPDLIARLFVGVGAVGIWDELFFICTVFALLRRHFPDLVANLLQAIVFVSFLWELGYREWGPLLTIPFALLQGFIFLRTHSLAYVVTVHLLFDAVVFAVLVHAHNPGLLPIFLV